MKVGIVIPVFDSALTIERLVDELVKALSFYKVEIVLV